jgi:hypothetical protein
MVRGTGWGARRRPWVGVFFEVLVLICSSLIDIPEPRKIPLNFELPADGASSGWPRTVAQRAGVIAPVALPRSRCLLELKPELAGDPGVRVVDYGSGLCNRYLILGGDQPERQQVAVSVP